jgi:hypothetical protein
MHPQVVLYTERSLASLTIMKMDCNSYEKLLLSYERNIDLDLFESFNVIQKMDVRTEIFGKSNFRIISFFFYIKINVWKISVTE